MSLSNTVLDPDRIILSLSKVTGVADRWMPRIRATVTYEYSPGIKRPPSHITGRTVESVMMISQHEVQIADSLGTFASSGTQYDQLQPLWVTTRDYLIPVSRYELASLEMKRKNDLSLTFRISGLAMISEAAKGSTVYPFVKPVVKEFSQAQWTRLLSEMGYEDVWIFEVAKPSITPGVKFVQAQKLLEEAQYDLPNGSPESVVAKCGQSLDLLLQSFSKDDWEKIGRQVDSRSSGQASRWERVTKVREDVRALSQPGGDRAVSFEDARLCFLLTASTVSYLSRAAAEALT